MTTIPQPGMTLRDLCAACDAEAVSDAARWGSGYHETQPPWAYDPAFEPPRDAFHELLEQIVRRELNGTFLQIGLGKHGGTQRTFAKIARRAVCVEVDRERIRNYDGGGEIVHGDSTDPSVIESVRIRCGTCDVVWIDGDASFESVRSDWSAYASLVRPGGLVVIVDGSQDRDFDGRVCDVDDFVRELRSTVLDPNGVTLSRTGSDRALHYYEQPASELDGEVRLPTKFVPTSEFRRVLEHEGFGVWSCGDATFGVDEAHEHFDLRSMRRGELGTAIALESVHSAADTIDRLRRAQDALARTRELLLCGDVPGAAVVASSVEQDDAGLEALICNSLGAFAYAPDLQLDLGTMLLFGDRRREGIAWLEAVLDRDPMNASLIKVVAAAHLELNQDQASARRVLERVQRRVATARLRDACSRMIDASPGLWRYPQLIDGLHGVIQVGAHRGEEIDAFTRAELPRQLYFEPHPDAFEDLRRACERNDEFERAAYPFAISRRSGSVDLNVDTDTARSSLLELRSGAASTSTLQVPSHTLDELVEQGVIDPAHYDLLVVDAEGAELEVLEGAKRLLPSIQVICVAVHYSADYVDAPTPERLSMFLAECDEYGFALRAHDPEGDGRRGNAVFTRCTRRRRAT